MSILRTPRTYCYLRIMRSGLLFLTLLFTFPLLGQGNLSRSNIETTDSQVFTAVVKSIDSFERWAVREQIQILGVYRPAKIVVLHASPAVFREKIAQHPLILFVSTTTADPKPELPVPGQNLFVNKINVAQAKFPHLNGQGSIVSIKEFRFDSMDVDLQNRVLDSPNAAKELTTHAAIMASLVGGAGNSDPQGRGAAPGCKMISTGFGLLLPEEDYDLQGVTVQNHAYGVGVENFYGANALAFDVSTQENPHLLHVFSAGNIGTSASETGVYANIKAFANLTGNFKMAKNVLTVGAVDSLGDLALFSSRGPTYDGRIKPDLVAFGQDGSSGAAALVSGAAAVLQQAYKEQFDSLPDSDLIRAILINSADDRGRAGPDFEYGFGNLNLGESIQTMVDQRFIRAEIAGGQMMVIPIVLPDNLQQFKISLVWNDAPAQAGVAKALIHDLDFKIQDPTGQSWQPWVLNTAPNADSLQLPAIRGRDTLNNVAQITMDNPMPGQYQIQVMGTDVAAGIQAFSLAYSFDTLGHFKWNYPMRNDHVTAAKEVVLRWESNRADLTGRLEWKPVGVDNWRLIDSALVLNNGVRRWLVPDTFTEAQVRVQAGTQFFMSDTFLIAADLRLKVGFNCPDSVGLFWNRAAPEAEYLLYGLGQYYLQPLFVTRDTFVSVSKSLFPQKRFAVAALGQHQASLSKRSAAPDIEKQGLECYQKSFFASLNAVNQVDLYLELGSLYGVVDVQFEKWDGAKFAAIKKFETIDNAYFAYTDPFPRQGRNVYRALISTSNTGMVLSDTASVYFTGTKNWLVFPNPISPTGTLRVLSYSSGDAEFRLFDALGRLVLSQILEEERVEIPLPILPEGFYFFEALEHGKRQWSGGLTIMK